MVLLVPRAEAYTVWKICGGDGGFGTASADLGAEDSRSNAKGAEARAMHYEAEAA